MSDNGQPTERRVGERRKQPERRIRYDTLIAGTHQDRRVQPRQRRLGSERRGADKQARAIDSNYKSAKEVVEEIVNFFELDAFDGQVQECVNRAWDILDRRKSDRRAEPPEPQPASKLDSERERAAKTFAEILGIAQQMAKLAREKSYIIGMENFAEAAEYICDKAKAAAIRRGEE